MKEMRDLSDYLEEASEAGVEFPEMTPEECREILHMVNEKYLREQIYRLYFDDEMTQKDVATTLGITRGKVQRIFKEMNWVGRHVEKIIDPIEVRKLYDVEMMTQEQIAKKFGVSRVYVWNMLQESKSDKPTKRRKVEIDLEKARFLYFEKGLPHSDIATELGVAQTTFSRRIRELGWKRIKLEDMVIEIKELHRLYFEEGLSQRAAAERLGVPITHVKREFKKMG